MRARSRWIPVFLAGFLAISGCRHNKPVRSVTIGIQDNTFAALVLVAQSRGFFEREGLRVTLRPYPSGKLALQGMFNGEVDLCTCSDLPIMAESFARDDFRVLCSIGYTSNGAWIAARRDHGIESPEDLRGKRIGTQRASAVHFFLSEFLLRHRIPESAVEIVFMPAVDLPGALEEGTLDAFSMRNPFIAQAKAQLGERVLEFFDPSAYRQAFLLVTPRDMIEADPSVARDVVAALVRAESFAAGNREEAVRLVAKGLGQGREEEVASDWDSYAFELGLSQSLVRGLENEAQWALESGIVQGPAIPDFRTLIHGEAMQTVRPASVSLID